METDNLDLAAALGTNNTEGTEIWNMGIIDQLTNLEGRINRLRYLLLQILIIPGSLVYGIIIGIFTFWLPEPIFTIILTVLSLPILYISYAVAVKRLQDTGRGDGWITYAQIGVGLNIAYMLTPYGSEIELFTGLVVTLALVPLGIVCLFFRGDAGPNQFGPDPLA
tara:strand:- start:115 stop:612 length:498 start_codon:yes stop_codon:yes gene_type:complete